MTTCGICGVLSKTLHPSGRSNLLHEVHVHVDGPTTCVLTAKRFAPPVVEWRCHDCLMLERELITTLCERRTQ
jgi:hypothetical protein